MSSSTFETSSSPPVVESRPHRRLKNRVSMGSVLAPLLFNTTYTGDLQSTTSKKYAGAEDLVIACCA